MEIAEWARGAVNLATYYHDEVRLVAILNSWSVVYLVCRRETSAQWSIAFWQQTLLRLMTFEPSPHLFPPILSSLPANPPICLRPRVAGTLSWRTPSS